ncbi:MAG: TfoX/Sxy family protein [Chloroflexota bacterium]
MASKGTRQKTAGIEAAAQLEEQLAALGVSARAMFGGHGLFKDEVMFAIVDSEGRLYLRADGSTATAFEAAGSTQHARMPYWEVPAPVREDPEQLREWAATAAAVAARKAR